jgi:hypothetical protein
MSDCMKCYIFVIIIFGSNRFILEINELQDEYSVKTANKELILKVRVSTDIHISSLVGGGKTDAFRNSARGSSSLVPSNWRRNC